ncbi:hemicentin-1-like [Chanos chanos]|uniref:Hemicentin-1-like n=1 Tax=Chanos chanos TaxID=29144 RepID=A0A6J2WHQ2_CHACN|nr:hemicentin-1-like [Chanos chanos]
MCLFGFVDQVLSCVMCSFGFLSLSLYLSSLSLVTADTCSLVLKPSSLTVRYGDPASATCFSLASSPEILGWTDPQQDRPAIVGRSLTWSVDTVTSWDLSPSIQCFTLSDLGEYCAVSLSIIIYKPPDSVSLRFVSGSGLMVEGNQYQLECEIQSVAPVQNLTVKWFRGKTLLNESNVSEFSVTGNIHENVTVTDRYTITASRDDHGVQYKCEAELKLGLPESLKQQSEPLNMTVLYGPEVTCPNRIRVRDSFNCTVVGYPIPVVSWFNAHQRMENPGSLLTDVGNYTVRAQSILGNSTHVIEVVDFSDSGSVHLTCGCGVVVLLVSLLTHSL